ncbi:MAG: hypothetical protein IAE99_00695 [Rhodothermales bacterium]|nr:hypothetical protein [Rhodothermales bacterium]
MKIQRVYVDTSVIGECFDAEFAPWSLGLFEDFRLGVFAPVVSTVVAREMADAPAHVRDMYDDLLRLGAEELVLTDEALGLADAYQTRRILTPKYYDDGTHIALATVSGLDLVVSWNFKHIVHFDRIRLFNAVNIERGYRPVEIRSPRDVTHFEIEP